MIQIPEMKQLPNNCHECPLSYWNEGEYWCPWHNCTVDYHGGSERRMIECPLVESEDENDTD